MEHTELMTKKPSGPLKAKSHLHTLALQSAAGDSCCELSQVSCLAMGWWRGQHIFIFREMRWKNGHDLVKRDLQEAENI